MVTLSIPFMWNIPPVRRDGLHVNPVDLASVEYMVQRVRDACPVFYVISLCRLKQVFLFLLLIVCIEKNKLSLAIHLDR